MFVCTQMKTGGLVLKIERVVNYKFLDLIEQEVLSNQSLEEYFKVIKFTPINLNTTSNEGNKQQFGRATLK